jgi:regulator of PEP synthase PpsR (kinase-PPPase family)
MTHALEILVISDATGATAEAVVTSALVQFGGAKSRLRRFPFTRTVDQVEAIIDDVQPGGIVVYTFVSRELSDAAVEMCQARDLVAVDMLGPLMGIFADSLHHAPSRTPGLYRPQSEDMFKVTEAIHYTLRHDDGNGLDTLDQADLIILGVSRTGKTPTSIFLSCRKLKVANIPIIRGYALPDELAELASTPKVGFTMDVDRQVRLRSERSSRFRTRIPGYAERAHIMSEIEYCNRLYRGIRNLRTIDVTYLSIEEISDWITHNVL